MNKPENTKNTEPARPAQPQENTERTERRWRHAAVLTSGADAAARLLDLVLRTR